jgi:hypothetical protein
MDFLDEALFHTNLNRSQKKDFVQRGVAAAERATQIDPNDWMAMWQLSRLVAAQARMADDASVETSLSTKAVELRTRALQLMNNVDGIDYSLDKLRASASQ